MSNLQEHNKYINSLYQRRSQLLSLKKSKKCELEITDDTFIIDEFKDTTVRVIIHCASIEPMDDILKCVEYIRRFKWKRLVILIYVVEELVDIRQIAKMTDGMGVILYKMKNYGLDIASFVMGLTDCQEDIIMKMHTKTDPYWRREMLSIFQPVLLYNSIKLLKNKNIGMIGTKKYIREPIRDWSQSINNIKTTISWYNRIKILCDLIKIPINELLFINSFFVAGTIFITKKEILKPIIDNVDIIYPKFNYFKRLKLTGEGGFSQANEWLFERIFGYLCIIRKTHLLGISYNAK